MFPDNFFNHLAQHTRTGIRTGAHRQQFTPIWIVQVDGRVFARSWTQSATGWFATLLATGLGELQFGDHILAITARQLSANNALQADIDKAYLARYTAPENIPYAIGITQPNFAHFTIELFAASH